VAERLGYTLEGVLRRHLPYGDHAGDEAVYSLLKEEWASTGQ
jgi:RimJ/RimL family protein N-acetyltransferase